MAEKNRHHHYMKMAISLAKKGMGKVTPNPLVGAVVIKNKEVVGTGYHRYFGGPHAEVEAIRKAGRKAKGASLYCNLEPCNHFGKTPPCTTSIIDAGIKKVYVSTMDPNPLVGGTGSAALQEQGVHIQSGICETDARKLNAAFFKFMERGQPLVSLKMAITADGFIADKKGGARWITSEKSRNYAHLLRASHDAVAVGIGTAKIDDPSINVRLKGRYRQPLRVVIDPRFDVDPRMKLFTEKGGEVVVFTSKGKRKEKDFTGVTHRPEFIEYNDKKNFTVEILSTLSRMGVTSLLVEGGAGVFSKFLKAGVVDRYYIFIAGKFFGRGLSPFADISGFGVNSPYHITIEVVKKMEEDILIEAVPGRRQL